VESLVIPSFRVTRLSRQSPRWRLRRPHTGRLGPCRLARRHRPRARHAAHRHAHGV